MENKSIKKIYFAGKFNILKNDKLPLYKRLINDYRSILLGDSKRLTYSSSNIKLSNGFLYNGPFYCEQASNGDFTSTDCNVVLKSEYSSIEKSDIYLVIFNENFSVGSIVELDWAIEMNKKIIIFYEEEESNYSIKSDYWFAIANALNKSKKVKVFKYKDIKRVIEIINKGEIFNEI